ncbi:hypothetical protein, partial [Selenomonas sp. WCT3]|uniref:hypothetical protein n=1 Tax=Selenomonas sp. WCT3 TaxID=3158785 RepID=UPI001C59E6FF
ALRAHRPGCPPDIRNFVAPRGEGSFVTALTEAAGPQYHKRSLDVPREARNFCLRSRWKSSFVQAKRV